MKKTLFLAMAGALALLPTGCATDGNDQLAVGAEKVVEKTSFSFDQDKSPYKLFQEYAITPGDVLDVLFQIRTWVEKERFPLAVDHTLDIRFVHAPELNQSQRVRPDGTISLPYLGIIHVVGKTVEELTDELRERYGTVLRNPEIFVVVPEFRSSIKELKADLHTAPRGLSRLTTVRPDGHVTFPMVGDINAAGKTIPEVNEELNVLYEEILPGLHCDLFLERHSGSVVYVVGQVRQPGSFKVVKPISVVEALTLAGSYTPGARLDSVMVVRKREDTLVATRVDIRDSLDFSTDTPFFYLQPDDIVYVPRTKLSQTAEVAKQIGDIIFFRGWSVGVGFSWELHDAQATRDEGAAAFPFESGTQ